MNYIIIDFPFQSVNDEQYHLALCLHNSTAMTPAINALNADSEVFTAGLVSNDGTNTTYHYTGTLTGSVKVTDDERSDFYEPIVSTKLTFNMAVQTFPEWLMQYCDLRWASVILYKEEGSSKYELWRGYLMSQSLNMTVVNNLLSCSLVAVDEIGMAKYMPLSATMSSYHTLALVTVMEFFHMIHYYNGFTVYQANGIGFYTYYTMLGINASARLLWHRDMAITDDNGNDMDDLTPELVVNLDRWLQDEDATWFDMLDAVCRYLGVTFCIGSYSGLTANDAYILSCPTDSDSIKQYEYIFGGSTTQYTTSLFDELSNPTKIGGDLQVSIEPDKYKSVVIESEPERWERHSYLQEKNYPEVDETKEVRYEWGVTKDAANGPFDELAWHKLKYIAPTTNETKYVELPDCEDGEGFTMAREGILPYDNIDSCTGLTQPTSAVADSLDFIIFKEGATCIKIGSGEMDGVDEDKALTPYFILLNHMWENMCNSDTYTMQNAHLNDTTFLAFKPFAAAAPTHPGEQHFFEMSMRVKFIRENLPPGGGASGSPINLLWFPAASSSDAMTSMGWTSPAMLLPCESSAYTGFEDQSSDYTGYLAAWSLLYMYAKIRVGSYYWNGRSWQTTETACIIVLRCENSETTEISKVGDRTIVTKNYYYSSAYPFRSNMLVDQNSNPKFIIDCENQSAHDAPFQGDLEIELLGQVNFINENDANAHNSVPFILIDNVDIGWTDIAEMTGKDIKNKNTVYMDYYSETKEKMTRSLVMASPKVDGFFNNALVYDGGNTWHNLTVAHAQGGSTDRQPEQMLAIKLAGQYAARQCFVELSTPIEYDDNLHNVDFKVTNLTEADGTFMPVKRTFDYTLERLRVKLQRVNSSSAT